MVNFGEKAKIKKAGNLNSGRSYVITTVINKKIVNFDFRSCGTFEWHDTRLKGITLILSVDHLCLLAIKRRFLNMKKR